MIDAIESGNTQKMAWIMIGRAPIKCLSFVLFFLMIYDDDIDFCLFVCLIRNQEFEMPFVCFF